MGFFRTREAAKQYAESSDNHYVGKEVFEITVDTDTDTACGFIDAAWASVRGVLSKYSWAAIKNKTPDYRESEDELYFIEYEIPGFGWTFGDGESLQEAVESSLTCATTEIQEQCLFHFLKMMEKM